MDLGVGALVCGEYRELGAIGVGGCILDGDVPPVLGELCAEAGGEVEGGGHGRGADGIGRVDEVEIQDAIMSLGTTFPVIIADLVKRGPFAAGGSCGDEGGIPVQVCCSCGSRL